MNELKVNVYAVLQECIEIGVEAGWNKAHKHDDNPSASHIIEQIEHYIMLQISEKFKFDE